MNNFLKGWWYIATIFLFTFLGWLIYYGIDKSQYYNFSNFFLFFHLILIFALFIGFLKVKKKIILFILIFYLLGNLIYFANIFSLNGIIQVVIKDNQFSSNLFTKMKNLIKGSKHDNKLFLENMEIEDDFNGQILIKVQTFQNIFVLKKKNNNTQLFSIFEYKTIKNANPIPFQLKKINENWELIYYDYNNITKVFLDNNFKFIKEIWNLNHKLSFHHWGDSYDGKLFVPGSTSKKHPVEEKFDLGFHKSCKKGLFYFETIEIIDEENGNYLESVSILDKISSLKKEFNENYDIINCKDPTHLNDVRVIKDSSIASSFPNGKVGDILLSILGIHAVVLLDRDDYHMKWYTIGKTRNQHSPRIVDEGKMLIFDNDAVSRIYGTSQITSIDIVNNKIAGIYKAENKDDYFQSSGAGRIQILDNFIFINESENHRLFKLECENLSTLFNCEKKNILKINNIDTLGGDPVFAHTLDVINN
jgi:hypothetical protein